MMKAETEICKLISKIYEGMDWHRLSRDEQEVVIKLEEAEYLVKKTPKNENGFVGQARK